MHIRRALIVKIVRMYVFVRRNWHTYVYTGLQAFNNTIDEEGKYWLNIYFQQTVEQCASNSKMYVKSCLVHRSLYRVLTQFSRNILLTFLKATTIFLFLFYI